MRAPIVGVALTMELTSSYTLVLPLMVTCVTANLIAQWSGGQPIYAQLLERTLAQARIRPPGGRPPAASHSAHHVGHSSSNQPIGRSPRTSFQYWPSRSRQRGSGGD